MMDTQHRVLVALGATAGAVAVCMLAHKVWVIRQQDDTLQVVSSNSSSSSWMPQALLQGAAALSSSARPRHQQQQLSPVIYDYAQSIEEVLVEAQLPAHIQQQDVQVKFGNSSLLLVVGQQRVIDGCLAGRILPQHSSWKIEGQGQSRKLSITLCKQPSAAAAAAAANAPQRYTVWSSLLAAATPAGDAPRSPEKRDQIAKKTAAAADS